MNTLLVVLLVFLLLLLVSAGVLYYLYSRNFPVNVYLTNNSASPVEVGWYVNEFEQNPLVLRPKQRKQFHIGSNITNNRTGKPLQRHEFKGVTFYPKTQTDLTFDSGNLPPDYNITFAKDLAGFSPVNPEHPNPGDHWKEVGYYIVGLPHGIPLF